MCCGLTRLEAASTTGTTQTHPPLSSRLRARAVPRATSAPSSLGDDASTRSSSASASATWPALIWVTASWMATELLMADGLAASLLGLPACCLLLVDVGVPAWRAPLLAACCFTQSMSSTSHVAGAGFVEGAGFVVGVDFCAAVCCMVEAAGGGGLGVGCMGLAAAWVCASATAGPAAAAPADTPAAPVAAPPCVGMTGAPGAVPLL